MLLNEALSIKKYNLSDMDESIADTEQWLGNVMRETGRLEEALDFFNSALKCKKAKLGNDHEDVADAMHNMAVVLDDLEKYELSVGCYQEVSSYNYHIHIYLY
jgi:tetratricopeptide (TPR) repeat protein